MRLYSVRLPVSKDSNLNSRTVSLRTVEFCQSEYRDNSYIKLISSEKQPYTLKVSYLQGVYRYNIGGVPILARIPGYIPKSGRYRMSSSVAGRAFFILMTTANPS